MAVEHDILLSPYTSWCVGGVADRLYRVADLDALSQFLSTVAPEEPLLWIGKGSNLLVRDGGFRGTVILLSEGADTLKWLPDQALYAEAGGAVTAEPLCTYGRSAPTRLFGRYPRLGGGCVGDECGSLRW